MTDYDFTEGMYRDTLAGALYRLNQAARHTASLLFAPLTKRLTRLLDVINRAH